MIVVERSGQFLHLVDGDGPADEGEHECRRVKPVIISVQLFLAGVDGLLVGLQFFLLDDALHGLHVLVLNQVLLVNFAVDEAAPKEGHGESGNEGDDCSPDDHGRAEELVAVDAGDDDALDGPIDQNDSDSGEPGEALLVGEVGQRIKRDAGPAIVFVVGVVDLDVGVIGDEVEQPVDEDPEPGEPQGHTLADVGLELSDSSCTFPVVIVLA